MERELNSMALQSAVFAFGAGKYSPLQTYLAVREPIQQYSADAFVLNFYTGNDFYDMLRVDDRPSPQPDPRGSALPTRCGTNSIRPTRSATAECSSSWNQRTRKPAFGGFCCACIICMTWHPAKRRVSAQSPHT